MALLVRLPGLLEHIGERGGGEHGEPGVLPGRGAALLALVPAATGGERYQHGGGDRRQGAAG
ncbi:hypothetical protein OIM90_16050 [Streptomyces sp. AD16]|nr:hypothetical protein OIM90_16050 [Streptomyces sp. AD16]